MNRKRAKLATMVTVVGLGGLAGVALRFQPRDPRRSGARRQPLSAGSSAADRDRRKRRGARLADRLQHSRRPRDHGSGGRSRHRPVVTRTSGGAGTLGGEERDD